MAKELDFLTKRSEDYSKWYNELVVKADLAEQSDVRGCMVIKPYGYAIWEKMQRTLDDMFKRWVVDGSETLPDIPLPENPELHLTVGTSGIVPPYSYYVGKELNGYDIELACRFAA